MFGQNTNQDQQQWQPQGDQPDPQGQPPLPPVAPAFDTSGAPAPDPGFNGFPGAPAPQAPTPEQPVEAAPTPSLPASGTAITTDELLNIKQEALQQLSPLVNHLEQSPEEKFRTTMMMIQAADDQSLLQTAYELAKQITDEKVRAQALLDVVNEINYFTQQHNNA